MKTNESYSNDEQDDAPDSPAEEAAETPEMEAGESAAKQEAEEEAGTEQHGGGDVKIPEEFQRKVESLLQGTNDHQLEYIRSCVMEREKEIRHSETKSEKGMMFDTEGLPE